ncbi:MAG: hypothetical protein JWQ98_1874 [Chlorobi bacterium]|nr:hypothetical protein [Chlorobiota bacterium]
MLPFPAVPQDGLLKIPGAPIMQKSGVTIYIMDKADSPEWSGAPTAEHRIAGFMVRDIIRSSRYTIMIHIVRIGKIENIVFGNRFEETKTKIRRGNPGEIRTFPFISPYARSRNRYVGAISVYDVPSANSPTIWRDSISKLPSGAIPARA